uniref:DAN domain-containing protein n=1 Tax=Clytia hemisphaerica TaxID=252671 RepID=A0A7M5WST5_9CNID
MKYSLKASIVVLFVTLMVNGKSIDIDDYVKCQAYDHPRLLKKEGCLDITIPDKMCKGGCISQAFPELKKNHQEEIAIQDDNDDNQILSLSVRQNQCPMCLPKKTAKRTFAMKCKKQNVNQRPAQLSSSSSSASSTTARFVDEDTDRDVGTDYDEIRQVEVDVLVECQCVHVPCNKWMNMKEIQKHYKAQQ